MNNYKVIANGTDMGTFEGKDSGAAIVAAVIDAGYKNIAEAAKAVNMSLEDFTAQIEVEKVTQAPVFESNCNTKADFYANPDSFENSGENAEPTSRCLSGTNDFWAAEEWAEPVTAPDGRKATKYYLFATEDITDDDGNALEADCYPWDAEHVSRVVIND